MWSSQPSSFQYVLVKCFPTASSLLHTFHVTCVPILCIQCMSISYMWGATILHVGCPCPLSMVPLSSMWGVLISSMWECVTMLISNLLQCYVLVFEWLCGCFCALSAVEETVTISMLPLSSSWHIYGVMDVSWVDSETGSVAVCLLITTVLPSQLASSSWY